MDVAESDGCAELSGGCQAGQKRKRSRFWALVPTFVDQTNVRGTSNRCRVWLLRHLVCTAKEMLNLRI
jgi:hypothetical protein